MIIPKKRLISGMYFLVRRSLVDYTSELNHAKPQPVQLGQLYFIGDSPNFRRSLYLCQFLKFVVNAYSSLILFKSQLFVVMNSCLPL
ncbi:hypothetical protein [Fischerella sp. JS2]|uniref:hypothetical protein n=1 Tax=Fischerella sp. JS2 TaxID=2597771 RepID=UPI0028EBA037|nr:hypothetical protein [Fischerella sp. JS2]